MVPPPGLTRHLWSQAVLFKAGDGLFLTGSAVFFVKVVGLTASQVGLGLAISGGIALATAIPAGGLPDPIGTKRVWAHGDLQCAGMFLAWPFIGGFTAYVVMVTAYSVVENTADAARRAYTLDALPPADRITSQALIYSGMNVGSTLGALGGGIALAFDSLTVMRWIPLLTAALFAINAAFVLRLPAAPHERAATAGGPDRERVRPQGPPALRNRPYLVLQACMGSLWTNQTLLSVLIPLWLVTETDSPHWLLAWLFGTNTVLCIFLPHLTSAGVVDVDDALRRVRWSASFFMLSCLITMATHSTTGLLTGSLVLLGHLTVTAAELATGSAGWVFQSQLQDPRRRGEYGSAGQLLNGLGGRWAPALYTWLAISWHHLGWIVIGLIVVAAAAAAHPAARAAERFAEREFPAEEELGALTAS